MSKVFNPDDYRIYANNGDSYATIYIGNLDNLIKQRRLLWNIDKVNAEFTKTKGYYLTLTEIADQLKRIAKTITIFYVTPTNSYIYQWQDGAWRMYDSSLGSKTAGGLANV